MESEVHTEGMIYTQQAPLTTVLGKIAGYLASSITITVVLYCIYYTVPCMYPNMFRTPEAAGDSHFGHLPYHCVPRVSPISALN